MLTHSATRKGRAISSRYFFILLILLLGAVPNGVHAQLSPSFFTSGTDRVLPPRPCRTDLDFTNCKHTTQKLAVDQAGNAIALWTESEYTYEGYKGDQYLHRVMTSRYSAANNSWTPPQHLQSEVGIVEGIGFDANNNAVAVWSRRSDYLPEINGPGDVLRSARYITAQATWTRAVDALKVLEGERSNLAVSRNGDAFIVGSGRTHMYLGIYHAATRSWRKLDLPNPNMDSLAASQPRVAADSTGNAIAAYADHRRRTDGHTSSIAVRYARYDAASRVIDKSGVLDIHYPDYIGTGNAAQPQNGVGSFAALSVAMDQYGKAMAVWEFAKTANGTSSGPVTRSIRSSRYTPGSGAWMRKSIPVISSGRIVGRSELAADRSSNVHAIWVQYVGSYAKTVYAKYGATSGTWNTPRVIQSGNYHSRDPRIAADHNGNVFAAWSQRSDAGTTSSTAATYFTTGARFDTVRGKWGVPRVIQDLARTSYRSELGIDGKGRAMVLWAQDTGRIYAGGQPVKELRADRLIPE